MKITTNELRQIIKEAWRSAGLETIPTAIQTKFPKALKDFEIVLPYEFNRDGTTKGQFTTTNEPLVGAREIFKQKPGDVLVYTSKKSKYAWNGTRWQEISLSGESSSAKKKSVDEWSWREFQKEFPDAAERLEEKLMEDIDSDDDNEYGHDLDVEGTFQAESPSVVAHVYRPDPSAIIKVGGKRKVLTYYDDNYSLAYDGYSQGWQSID